MLKTQFSIFFEKLAFLREGAPLSEILKYTKTPNDIVRLHISSLDM
jgi:hypothetical protein